MNISIRLFSSMNISIRLFSQFSSLLTVFVGLLVASAAQAPVIEEGEIVEAVDEPLGWTGSFAAGFNGKTGNSENLDVNFAVNVTRESDFASLNFIGNYFYASSDVTTTTDRWFSQFRQEIKLRDERWSWFNQAGVEIDRFKDFDYRIALHTFGLVVVRPTKSVVIMMIGRQNFSLGQIGSGRCWIIRDFTQP